MGYDYYTSKYYTQNGHGRRWFGRRRKAPAQANSSAVAEAPVPADAAEHKNGDVSTEHATGEGSTSPVITAGTDHDDE